MRSIQKELFQHYSVYCIEYSEMVCHQPPPSRCQIQLLMYHYTFDVPSYYIVCSKWTVGSHCSFITNSTKKLMWHLLLHDLIIVNTCFNYVYCNSGNVSQISIMIIKIRTEFNIRRIYFVDSFSAMETVPVLLIICV